MAALKKWHPICYILCFMFQPADEKHGNVSYCYFHWKNFVCAVTFLLFFSSHFFFLRMFQFRRWNIFSAIKLCTWCTLALRARRIMTSTHKTNDVTKAFPARFKSKNKRVKRKFSHRIISSSFFWIFTFVPLSISLLL